MALDIDVFTMDNSNTRKGGVSQTYAGFYGYSPIAAYLGVDPKVVSPAAILITEAGHPLSRLFPVWMRPPEDGA
ncbi:mobile element protein [Halorhodospira halochloris]|uniref:Mobile element protein n=1 Tax=Halorhodospira halochloris TaxID=1052 RepID=A0A110B5T9_HALHR|nr:hypothetical protein [Halorhodospira halochloris]BAU58077.1 mobile element protein [Halorhodospira halochloris]